MLEALDQGVVHVDELADAARIVAPVSEQQAALFTSMADTFEALGRDEGALKQTISDAPPTMDVAIESFREQRPFLANLEGFCDDFAPATDELRGALPTLRPNSSRSRPARPESEASVLATKRVAPLPTVTSHNWLVVSDDSQRRWSQVKARP